MKIRLAALIILWFFLMPALSFGAEEKKNALGAFANVVSDVAFGKSATSTGAEQARKLAQRARMKPPEAVKSRKPIEVPKVKKQALPPKPSALGPSSAAPAGTQAPASPIDKKLKQFSKEEYLEHIKGILDYNRELLDFIQEVKKVKGPDNKEYYALNGTNIDNLDVDALQKLYLRIQNEYVRIRTERINKQMETILQAQRAAQQAQQAARVSAVPAAPQQPYRPPLPPTPPPSSQPGPQVPKPPPQAPTPPRK